MVEEMNSEMNVTTLQKGDIVKGKISKIEEKQALVDVGYKYDGIIPIGEISNIHIESVNDALQVGDEIELKVLRINDEEERLVLTKKALDSEKAWENLEEKTNNDEIFEVVVADVVKGGLVVDIGIRGFIPASMVEKHFVEDFSDYKGKTLRVKVVELDKEKNKAILSQRVVLEQEDEVQKLEAINKIKAGEIIEGTVQRLTDFGAFVNIGGIDGLVHVSEIAWDRVEKPADVLKEGDKVQVKVLRVDSSNQRISLSIKETKESPWQKAKESFEIGKIYTGKVKRLVSFGAFVELVPNVEGLVHISQISQDHITKPNEVLSVDQEVSVKVLGIDATSERISLSIKEAEENAYLEKKAEYEDQGLNVTLGDVFGDKLKKYKIE